MGAEIVDSRGPRGITRNQKTHRKAHGLPQRDESDAGFKPWIPAGDGRLDVGCAQVRAAGGFRK